MSLLRYDVTTHDWVIYAPERAGRPREVHAGAVEESQLSACPFCPGHEAGTGPETLSIPDPRHPGQWSVRAVLNKFPALSRESAGGLTENGRHFQEFDGYGAHEVIIESPDHFRTLAMQPADQIERILSVLQMRYRGLMGDSRLRAIIIFKNHRAQAGTSLRHPHWQILATPLVPHLLRQKHAIATDYFDRNFKCLHLVLLNEELAAGRRIVAKNEEFAAFVPYASYLPYQIRIMPIAQQPGFSKVSPARMALLAALLKDVFGKLNASLGDPAFNLSLVSPPISDEDEDYFLWHIDIFPRLFTQAGFELGSGMAINPVLPETAAGTLRGQA
ncbi:MAG: galT [Fibrobacteres bacterium]|nr:galT [Fibrobacterota bacterium]